MKLQAAKGSVAMATVTLVARPVGIASMAILARLLDPADFGIIALAMVFFGTTRLFSDFGMSHAVIQNQRPDNEIAFPAFFVTSATALLIFGLVNLNMDALASLMGDEALAPIMRWLSLLILLDAMAIVPTALLRKHMNFGLVGKSLAMRDVVNNSMAILFAFGGLGLWSLVYGYLIGAGVSTAMIWWASPNWIWIIPCRLQKNILRELLRYGVTATSGGVVHFFNTNWDDWFVGRTMGATALGFYSKAYNLTNGTIVEFNQSVIGGVFLPSYARIQGDKARLTNVYLKALAISALMMAPLAMGVFAVSDELVHFLFGEKWMPMAPALRIFAFMALARPLAASVSPLFRALGRPELDLRSTLVVLVVLVPSVLALADRGIEGVAVAVTAAFLVGLLFNVYQLNQVLPGIVRRLTPAVWPSLAASALMVGAVTLARPVLTQTVIGGYNWLMLAALVGVGGVVFLSAGYVLERTLILEVWQMLRTVLRRRSKTTVDENQTAGV